MRDLPDDTWEFAGACDEPGRIKGRCIGHRVTIEAPPELVWDLLADFRGWKNWNPLYGDTAGIIEEGEVLAFAVHLAGLKPRRGRAIVHKVLPNELLEYRLTGLAGLFGGFRFIEVEELSPTRCRVANGEIMGGLLGPLLSRLLGTKVAQGLRGMNESLKAAAERRWWGRAG